MRQNKKDQGIGDVVSNFGFAFELLKVIAHAVMAKGGNMQHLRRIVKEPALQRQIADLVVPAGSDVTSERPLGENEYLVPITYAPLPSLAALKREFGANNVSDIFDGREWELHSSCNGMDRTPGEKMFFLHDVGRDWEREEQIAWGLAQRTAAAPNGFRPATHDEEYEFQKAHPELLNYVALGSSARYGDGLCVARVWSRDGQRFFDFDWLGLRFGARCRVLFVRK